MKFRPTCSLFVVALAFAAPVVAQEPADPSDFAAPILTIEQPSNTDSLGMFSQEETAPAPPTAQKPVRRLAIQNTTVDEYRSAIKKLSARRHQYVHVKLRNGKVLTGLLRDVGDEGFSLYTEALGGPSLAYRDPAESPRPVPAVGTRIKQAAEWTGFVTFVAVFFIPLALAGAIPEC
ncbi:MAG TPA: hypothetical protein VKD70_04715 [Candidatus Acidoferrum sp.]|nr:hypothetical protein [Candidatus Acidoferrum sp.]